MKTPSFFEGPEKKLEVVVTPDHPSLRSLGDSTWRGIVEAAGAEVISLLQTERCDAYLLSESSLFVFDDWFVMITCGRTDLAKAVPKILRSIPKASIAFLVYERKSEHFPEHQPSTFYDDASRLKALIPGRALCFGDEHGRHIHMFHSSRPYTPANDDPTLEVLMHVIDEDVARQFAPVSPEGGVSLARSSGIDQIIPGFVTSEHLFDPAGYSLNAVRGDEYYTVHVTPEETGSYVSFETNYDFREQLDSLVRSIVELFKPRAFDVVTFLPEAEPALSVSGYQVGDHVVEAVSGYQVAYFQYSTPPSGPRPAREIEV